MIFILPIFIYKYITNLYLHLISSMTRKINVRYITHFVLLVRMLLELYKTHHKTYNANVS